MLKRAYVLLTVLCLLAVPGCGNSRAKESPAPVEKQAGRQLTEQEQNTRMKIKVTNGTTIVVFELNNSPAAKSLYQQLPLTTKVENYSSDEKIFYPEKLDTENAIPANADIGTLAYFAPWGDVVMYYQPFGSYSGLYELGQAISGRENIQKLDGEITITAE